MTNYYFVQTRHSSKKLMGKILKKLAKLTLLDILIERLSKSKLK